MTLVEVVAGLALLGSLLAGLLMTKSALGRQRAEAERRLAAVRCADELLSDWRANGESVPRHASGRAGPDDVFTWRTRPLRVERVADMRFDVVRLELSADGVGSQRDDAVLASVDVLLSNGPVAAPPAAQEPRQ